MAERILFVTGKLAEPGLRRVLADLAPRAGFEAEVAVMPITVAALLTTPWIAKRLNVPHGTHRVILPGLCRGELDAWNHHVERGPDDFRDLPEYFGQTSDRKAGYGGHDIEILAEINHAPKFTFDQIFKLSRHYRASGADVIDLGCDPGATWDEIGEITRQLVAEGFRVSVDSFNDTEVSHAVAAGAELILSVNSSNVERCLHYRSLNPHVEVVAIPDAPSDTDSLARTVERLETLGIRYRIDPILVPIGFGFAASLGRYLDARKRYPNAEMMMGVGNLTELTNADSAGINVLLAGFCQELGIRSVLTTEVAPWAQSSVREFALARQLVYHALNTQTLPKRLEPELHLLRDPKIYEQGQQTLDELARQITDRNYRIFAERGELTYPES